MFIHFNSVPANILPFSNDNNKFSSYITFNFESFTFLLLRVFPIIYFKLAPRPFFGADFNLANKSNYIFYKKFKIEKVAKI
jgi:hypothetical protein